MTGCVTPLLMPCIRYGERLMKEGETMRKAFDLAYEYFCDAMAGFEELAACMIAALILLTTPLWVIPYIIIKKYRGD